LVQVALRNAPTPHTYACRRKPPLSAHSHVIVGTARHTQTRRRTHARRHPDNKTLCVCVSAPTYRPSGKSVHQGVGVCLVEGCGWVDERTGQHCIACLHSLTHSLTHVCVYRSVRRTTPLSRCVGSLIHEHYVPLRLNGKGRRPRARGE